MQAASSTGLIDITAFEVEGYKAFAERTRIELGRITVLLGRNNAGKTALCLAPGYFARAFAKGAAAPFPPTWEGLDFGPLQSVCYQRQLSGLLGALELTGIPLAKKVVLGATAAAEHDFEQVVTQLVIEPTNGRTIRLGTVSWDKARSAIATIEGLSELPGQVRVLRGIRPAPERMPKHLGYTPDAIGTLGEHAAMILRSSGDHGLEVVNGWFDKLGVKLSIVERGDQFEILARGNSGEAVNLVDSGAGLAHILPLVVAVLLANSQPALRCIEQPELHLHPRAHVLVAELLLQSLELHKQTRLLVETHSDVLVLRLRRAIAARKLNPADIRIYFVDEEGASGSRAREIKLNDRATPDWWPKDVFAESQKEYFALRQALSANERV